MARCPVGKRTKTRPCPMAATANARSLPDSREDLEAPPPIPKTATDKQHPSLRREKLSLGNGCLPLASQRFDEVDPEVLEESKAILITVGYRSQAPAPDPA